MFEIQLNSVIFSWLVDMVKYARLRDPVPADDASGTLHKPSCQAIFSSS